MKLRPLSLVLAFVSLAFTAGDWPQFRGPDGVGISDATGLPAQWSDSQNIAWRADLPGPGASSPITWEGRIYLTGYTGYGIDEANPGEPEQLQRYVASFDLAQGKQLWSVPAKAVLPEQPFQGFQALHGYASSTPATDGKNLYVFFGASGVGALTVDGKPKWHHSVGTKTHNWGSGTSPLLYKNLVIINASVESGVLVALDKNTGREVWTAGGVQAAWNSPLLVDVPGGGQELVISSRGEVLAYDPASGERLWRCEGVQDYVCPSVVADEGIVYAIGGRSGAAIAVRAGGRGDVTETHRLWIVSKGSNVSSPVYHDGYLYWVHESRGIAYCVDGKTGEMVYEQRLDPRPDRIYASPVLADGKIFVVSRSAGVFVLAAKPEFELVAHNKPLDKSIFNASPAVADGKLLIRSNEKLYCIEGSE